MRAGATSPCSVVGGPAAASLPNPSATMIMDGLDTLPAQHHHHHHHHSAFLLTESAAAAAAAHHFNVLSFDTCLYKSVATTVDSGGSPAPAAACTAADEPPAPEAQPGDLNTPVTTSGDIPSFFGPSTVVEPPPITGESTQVHHGLYLRACRTWCHDQTRASPARTHSPPRHRIV